MSSRTRVFINGFGRIGRLALRAGWHRPDIEFVGINEIKGGLATAAHLLEFDSVQGRWTGHEIRNGDRASLIIDDRSVPFTEAGSPDEVPCAGSDVVLECTGKFRTAESLKGYFAAGARKVIVAAPVKEGALNIVMGVNDHPYDSQKHQLLTAASCTTNCFAPVVKVIHERIGIRHGIVTTIHDATNTQTVVDAPHKDLRRARAAGLSLIPTSTGLGDCYRTDLS
jgi:glyceraldehyde 3-phosphate dehydrogenase